MNKNLIGILLSIFLFSSFSLYKKYTSGVFLSESEISILNKSKNKLNLDQIVDKVGFPNITEEENVFYYVGILYNKLGFLKPKISKSDIIELKFDKNQILTDVKRYKNSAVNDVKIHKHIVDPIYNRTNFINKFISNAQKYNKSRDQKTKPRVK